ELCIPIPQELVHKVTGVPPRTQSRILALKQPRTLYSIPDFSLDPRGRKRLITRTKTAAIANYLNDDLVLLDNKGKP
ncbi:hypothetical protein V2W45_1225783, partial [Cenococcum geophilum]